MFLEQPQTVSRIIQLDRMSGKGISQFMGTDIMLLAAFRIDQPG
jgi:hypothetical protein